MNYAVLKSGGKQYRVTAGDVILIEKIIGESGSKVTFDDIIMMGEGAQIHVEENELKAASVTGEVIEQTRGPKLLVFKKKRRHNYRRKKGHKQDLTAVRIQSIDLKKAPCFTIGLFFGYWLLVKRRQRQRQDTTIKPPRHKRTPRRTKTI